MSILLPGYNSLLATNFIVSGFGVISVYILITGLPVLIITHYLICKFNARVAYLFLKLGKLMVAVFYMGVIMYAARPKIKNMSCNDQQYSRRKQPQLILMPYLLGNQ